MTVDPADFQTKAGRLINQINKLAEIIDPLPRVERYSDPTDDFLLALSEGGKADTLVTGDKSGLVALVRHKATDRNRRRICRVVRLSRGIFQDDSARAVKD